MEMGNYNWKRKKDPLTGKWYWPTEPHRVRKLPLFRYIETRTKVDPITGCWTWIEAIGRSAGHTELLPILGKKRASIGRASWACFFGPIPFGLFVCHECDNGFCANPM